LPHKSNILLVVILVNTYPNLRNSSPCSQELKKVIVPYFHSYNLWGMEDVGVYFMSQRIREEKTIQNIKVNVFI
jgi:hypothetical protein